MVKLPSRRRESDRLFQYSLCRVVLMVYSGCPLSTSTTSVSVLALSSRFDGPRARQAEEAETFVSVLALSSRFDGRKIHYLCLAALTFQYSLCRVVLMVTACLSGIGKRSPVSVLALSSRFDGRLAIAG